MDVLRRTIAGYARHPNFAGVLILGLGCEANQIGGLMATERLEAGPLLQTMTIQESGGTAKTVREGVARLKEMLPEANAVRRADRCRRAISRWRCNAAARTAIPASPPIRRWAPRSICWCATAARRCSPRRRRSTAPSIC